MQWESAAGSGVQRAAGKCTAAAGAAGAAAAGSRNMGGSRGSKVGRSKGKERELKVGRSKGKERGLKGTIPIKNCRACSVRSPVLIKALEITGGFIPCCPVATHRAK